MTFSGGRRARLAIGVLAALAQLGASRTAFADSPPAPPRVFAIRPVSGPATGGTSASIYGQSFAAGATVSIGGAAATGVVVSSPSKIGSATPALAPGSVNDVVVSVPGSTPVVLNDAWFARFLDVPPTHLFARPIEKLRRTGITTGCGGGNYCPEDSVTRAQMAVFILRGKHGSSYHPPPATGTVFDDVPKTALFADWMEQFAAEGITTGCGGKNYCPNNSVTRGEMAVFLLRARHGSAHNPPAPTGVFLDVTATTPFAKWIEQLAGEAITTGCGGGNYCPTGPSTRGQMGVFLTKAFAGSSREMIADDLAAGAIDYETSLLYRFYALYADERLPVRYQSAPPDPEDTGLFEEVQLVFPDLSPSGQAALAPFLARPDDPASPFGPAPSQGLVRRPDDGPLYCQTEWRDTSAAGGHFLIHLCSSGDEDADNTMMAGVQTVAESLWTPMTAAPSTGMGPPLGDCYTPTGGSETCPGGDARIDVYIVAANQCFKRNGRCWPLSATGVARAVPCEPAVGNKKSGYMLLSKERASSPEKIKSDFAHEFFHVLQFAHNSKAMAFDTGTTTDDGERLIVNNWYVESSATWSEWHFVPATAPEEVHWRFSDDYQPSHLSLLAYNPSDHAYASYIWSFFAQQEKPGPGVVFDAWVAAEGAGDSAGITNAVDQQMKFKDHFRDFAVRNWNADLNGQPIPVLYKDLHASDGSSPEFPTAQPAIVNRLEVTPDGERKQKQHVEIESLAAQYDEINVDPDVKKVILRFDKLPDAIDADLLVGFLPNTWKRRKVEDKGDPVVYCRDKPDEKVFRIIVILSNHAKEQDGTEEGDYEVERRKSCCSELGEATSVVGHVTFDYVGSAPVGADTIYATQSGNLTATLYPVLPVPPGSISFQSALGGVTGSATVHDEIDYESGDSVTLDGSGSPTSNSTIALFVDLETCICTFGAGPYVNATSNPGGAIGPAGVGSVTGDGISVKNFADVISGGGGFPAHSPSGVQAGHSVYIPGGLGILMFADPANENGAGTAAVTYAFTPEIPDEDLARTTPKK